MDGPRIGFVGAGTLGTGLALGLAAKRYRVVAASSRNPLSAQELASRVPGCVAVAGPQELADGCDLVFITTPDDVINQMASMVEWRRGQGVVHCCGAESLEVLQPAADMGADTGSFHPFQTFACLESPDEAVERLEGTSFAIEGGGWLLGTLERMASDLGGRVIHLRPEDRAIYHASGLMAAGYLVALIKAAAGIWQAMGVPREEAVAIVLPLAESTITNLSRSGIDASVTGPLVRGDTTTMRRHLEALECRLPHLVPLYCSLALESLPLAANRVSGEVLEAMEQLIVEHGRKHNLPAQG